VTLVSVGFGYGLAILFYTNTGRLLQKFSNSRIFTVCPRCGYPSIMPTETCFNCSYEAKKSFFDGTDEKNEAMSVPPESDMRTKASGMYRNVPVAVAKGIRWQEGEAILAAVKKPSMKLHSIVKDKEHFTVNRHGNRCVLNWVLLTNKRICFLSEMFGGWRDIYCYPYDDVTNIKITNKHMYTPLLDEADKLTIQLREAEFTLQGMNPKTLFDTITNHVAKYRVHR
jgi:hypothetical protein